MRLLLALGQGNSCTLTFTEPADVSFHLNENCHYQDPERRMFAISFMACLAMLSTFLEPHWSWMIFSGGMIVTHMLIGQLYLSRAISICCLQPASRTPSRSECVRACATLVIIELSGSLFFGAFGASLGALLQQILGEMRNFS